MAKVSTVESEVPVTKLETKVTGVTITLDLDEAMSLVMALGCVHIDSRVPRSTQLTRLYNELYNTGKFNSHWNLPDSLTHTSTIHFKDAR